MKNRTTIIGSAVLLAAALIFVFFIDRSSKSSPRVENNTNGTPQENKTQEFPAISVVAENLEIPWDIAFLPEGGLLVTERTGSVLLMDETGKTKKLFAPGARPRGEGGLLGMTPHPDFSKNRFVYFYMTAPGAGAQTENRVERYRFSDGIFTERRVIISGIPGAVNHDGGRIEFGPDELLYITTGDAGQSSLAQDVHSLAGKILRLRDDGTIPAENPFGTVVYSYGHRNPQGLAWDDDGDLWATEHGRSGILSGFDELNLIRAGANYGWPDIQGNETKSRMTSPVLHSGSDTTWAPASAAYLNGSIFFGGLRGEALYEAVLDKRNEGILDRGRVAEFKTHFKGTLGRIRTVRVGPDGMLYLTTSNRDGRGTPREGDDKIIRVNPALLE